MGVITLTKGNTIIVENEETILDRKKKRNLYSFLLGFCFTMLIILSFAAGSYYTCSNSNGTMLKGFVCADVIEVGVCEYQGRLYKTDIGNRTVFMGFNS